MSGQILDLDGARAGACPFGLCDGSGFVVDENTNTASDCRCRAQRIARRRASSLEARIPNRYRATSFEQLEGDSLSAFPAQISVVRRFAGTISQNIEQGNSMWIMGDVGTGKTALAMLVSKAALAASRTVAIYSLPRLLALIRESIEREEGVVGFLERLSAVDLLHIDDVGAENRTDWALEQLYTIVNTRYEERRSIVLTTNLDHKALAEQVGERIVSRLVEMCGDTVVPLYGEDRRRRPPEQRSARALA
ncbi:MAG TPA: ATP-binding protein [Solirubrobacteraceae bacterium]|jgi:DNA replication protein DnaC|nr:ATP-binding protein [Solirubrobacteraceae bacterium]